MEFTIGSRKDIANEWKIAWSDRYFRIKLVTCTIFLFLMILFLPVFFAAIELRNGPVLNDRILQILPPRDFSIFTFIIIWSMIAFLIVRSIQNPTMFLTVLISITLLFLARMLTITFVPLNPPSGLIPLKDPLSSFFYGHSDLFITKDLFFSGHTSTQFLIFLCFENKRDKLIALASTCIVGLLVLIQHVHYTIDVMGAIFLTYLIYLLGKRMANYKPGQTKK